MQLLCFLQCLVGVGSCGVQPAAPSCSQGWKRTSGCSACSDSWAREMPPLLQIASAHGAEVHRVEARGNAQIGMHQCHIALAWFGHDTIAPIRAQALLAGQKGAKPPRDSSGGGTEGRVSSTTAISTSAGPSFPAGHPDRALAGCQMASQKQIITLDGEVDVISFTAAFTSSARCPAGPRQHGCAGGGEWRR